MVALVLLMTRRFCQANASAIRTPGDENVTNRKVRAAFRRAGHPTLAVWWTNSAANHLLKRATGSAMTNPSNGAARAAWHP
jgi:hypothetical protein